MSARQRNVRGGGVRKRVGRTDMSNKQVVASKRLRKTGSETGSARHTRRGGRECRCCGTRGRDPPLGKKETHSRGRRNRRSRCRRSCGDRSTPRGGRRVPASAGSGACARSVRGGSPSAVCSLPGEGNPLAVPFGRRLPVSLAPPKTSHSRKDVRTMRYCKSPARRCSRK